MSKQTLKDDNLLKYDSAVEERGAVASRTRLSWLRVCVPAVWRLVVSPQWLRGEGVLSSRKGGLWHLTAVRGGV